MKKHRKYGGDIFQYCLPRCVISPSSVIMHRALFETVGLFNESLPACEDYDMWLRICARRPILFVDEPLIVKYGGHRDQLSRHYHGMDRFRILALANILDSGILDQNARGAAINTLIKKAGIYLNGARKRNNRTHIDMIEKLVNQYRP